MRTFEPVSPGAVCTGGRTRTAEILDDLTQADRRLFNFSSNGIIRMRPPGEESIQRFDTSHVRFQRPARFFADARKLGQGIRVYINGNQFLLEVQSDQVFYYGTEGDRFEDIALDIAPSLLFRELFLVDTLAELAPEQVELLSYDAAGYRAELGVYRNTRPRSLERRLLVANGPEGWRVLESELFDPAGTLVCRTTCDEYVYLDGVFMPTLVEVAFPETGATMSYEIRPSLLRTNREEPRPVADVDEIRETLLREGYREIRDTAGKESVP